MKTHKGMRPQDIAVLLKINALKSQEWNLQSLSHGLHISLSEVSESLNRSRIAGLVNDSKKEVRRKNLLEFLLHGVKYVFPAQMASLSRGCPTAHSHAFFADKIHSEQVYVWPHLEGIKMGVALEPLYAKAPLAAMQDPEWHKLMALVDVIRVGKKREVAIASQELERVLSHE